MPYFSNHYNIYQTAFESNYKGNISKFDFIIIENSSYWAHNGNPSVNSIAYEGISDGSFVIIDRYQNINILENVKYQ